MPKTCPKCRRENPDAQAACAACGWPLDQAPSKPADAAPPAPAPAEALRPPSQPETDRPGPEGLLWAGRASYKAVLDRWVLYGLAVIAVLVLYFWVDQARHGNLHWFLGILAWIVILPPGLWLAGKTLYLRWATGYRLTEERLFIDRGLLSRITDQTELIRVDDVQVRQGPIERLLGLGNVVLTTTDASDPKLVISGIMNPAAVAEHVRTQMRKLRKRGLYVESL